MKIFITGATGLIGANSTLELLRAGYQVRLLVRNADNARAYFKAHGFDIDDIVVADMLDKASVKAGMAGCDAVLHSAAIVDLDARNAERTRETNLQSIESVIGSACELGIGKILYVSSMSVFYDFSQPVLTEDTPMADVHDAYSLSKKLCETRIRELQHQGYPIISTYPSAVFGPDDPKLAESNSAIIRFLTTVVPLTSSGMQFIDARDIAIAHRLLLEGELDNDRTKERYILGGTFVRWPELADLLERAAGRKLWRLPVPGPLFRVVGVLFDLVRHLVPIEFPISREATRIVTQLPLAESSRLHARTGLEFRPPLDTLTDTIAWMRKAGKVK
ncbi:Aurachin B dehydrogenase [BD1-7 clade bacterium]|uniref:Aurachin B dehydrogenase n=1 Tax=BD1-7 clade bacterium TaxID=2029982 RepID=A0A5S9PJ79_9GAMM|nr:Aurachin B dehydrogenase [BD1-7 clade bacterium]CAA0104123.1 Aurachin B dehydrogenase [BD1-7 clade bacterium]